jgi:hypothetical protein
VPTQRARAARAGHSRRAPAVFGTYHPNTGLSVTIAARAATARLPENGRSPGAVSNVLVSVVAGLAAAAAGLAVGLAI